MRFHCIYVHFLCRSLPPLFGWNRYILEGMGTTCSFDYITGSMTSRSLILAMFFGGFILPLLVIIICYGCIYWAVRTNERMFYKTGLQRQVSDKHRNSRGGGTTLRRSLSQRQCGSTRRREPRSVEYKTAKTALIAVVFYCVAWTPYAAVALTGAFGSQSHLTPLVSALPCIFAKMSTLYNPFLYSLMHPRFRQKVRQLSKSLKFPMRRGTYSASSKCSFLSLSTKTNNKSLDTKFESHRLQRKGSQLSFGSVKYRSSIKNYSGSEESYTIGRQSNSRPVRVFARIPVSVKHVKQSQKSSGSL